MHPSGNVYLGSAHLQHTYRWLYVDTYSPHLPVIWKNISGSLAKVGLKDLPHLKARFAYRKHLESVSQNEVTVTADDLVLRRYVKSDITIGSLPAQSFLKKRKDLGQSTVTIVTQASGKDLLYSNLGITTTVTTVDPIVQSPMFSNANIFSASGGALRLNAFSSLPGFTLPTPPGSPTPTSPVYYDNAEPKLGVESDGAHITRKVAFKSDVTITSSAKPACFSRPRYFYFTSPKHFEYTGTGSVLSLRKGIDSLCVITSFGEADENLMKSYKSMYSSCTKIKVNSEIDEYNCMLGLLNPYINPQPVSATSVTRAVISVTPKLTSQPKIEPAAIYVL
jgi:hypothetical protein